jgi:hypothetical protein
MYVFGELKFVVKEVRAAHLQTSLENPWPRGAQFLKSPCNCIGWKHEIYGGRGRGYTETD